MHADGALVSPDVHHEESTQVAVDCIGFGVLLVAVLGDSPSPSYFSFLCSLIIFMDPESGTPTRDSQLSVVLIKQLKQRIERLKNKNMINR